MMKILPINYIVSDPEIENGHPYIGGTVISVKAIVKQTHYYKLPPEQVALTYNLSMSQVYAALSYYHDHPEQIEPYLTNDSVSEKRIANLHPHAMTMSDDFDDPLPLSFWLGDDE